MARRHRTNQILEVADAAVKTMATVHQVDLSSSKRLTYNEIGALSSSYGKLKLPYRDFITTTAFAARYPVTIFEHLGNVASEY